MPSSFPLGRRLGAWFLDNLILLTLSGAALWFLVQRQTSLDTVLRSLNEPPGVSAAALQDWETLAPADQDTLDGIVRHKVLVALLQAWPNQFLDQLAVILDPGHTLGRALDDALHEVVNAPEWAELSDTARHDAARLVLTLQKILVNVGPNQVLLLVWRLVHPIVLVLALLPPVFFLSELLWGRSLGKALFGLAVVRQGLDGTQSPADPWVRVWRWSVKCSGWLVFAAGWWFDLWIVEAIGVGLGVILGLGGFGVFNDSAQSLHDGLSGTGVGRAKTPTGATEP